MKNKKIYRIIGAIGILLCFLLMSSGSLPVKAANYTVYLDGTNGGIALYSGATNVSQPVNTGWTPDGQITLPRQGEVFGGQTIKPPTKSTFKLNGWYDITHRRWYAPGSQATINSNTVFYADWVDKDYNIGQNVNTVPTVDTSKFVTTQMFDYNDLFNMPDLYTTASRADSTWQHPITNETWQFNSSPAVGRKFLVVDGHQSDGEIIRPNGRPTSGTNITDGAYGNMQVADGDHQPYPGIITPNLYNRAQDMFKTDGSVLGVHYVGEGNHLFQYDNNRYSPNYGYYYYDSKKNAAAYNKSAGRFYVYNYTERTEFSLNQGDFANDFLPFNYLGNNNYGNERVYDGKGDHQAFNQTANYWFGMKNEIRFFMPDDPGTKDGNKAVGGKDMIYRFSGDDDVWVTVDGKMVLDLGGIHHMVYGEINFSTGVVTIKDRGNQTTTKRLSDLVPGIKGGDHKLTMYYMERGASQSNCSLYFNIAPRYGMTITKQDKTNANQKLSGARFAVYTDEACTSPATLWDSQADAEAENATALSKNEFETGSDGRVYFYGMYAGRTYYMKEVSAPASYPSISDKVIQVTFDKEGKATVTSDGSFATLADSGGGTRNLAVTVTNEKPPETEIKAEKKWYNDNGTEMTSGMPESVKVKLYRKSFPNGTIVPPAPEPEPSELPNIPVTIRTQYFGSGNGSNTDLAWLTRGDVTRSTVVKKGGKLELSLDATNGGTAAIYAVTVNGRRITPTTTSTPTSENCYIGGRWGNYPPRKATYVIDPVNESTNIMVTLIGYIGYNGSVPNVSNSLDVHTIVTNPTGSSSGGGTGGSSGGTTTTPTIPSEKPSDAEAARYKDAYGGPNGAECETFDLTAANQWGKNWPGWQHLPTKDADGNPYYYYVVEEPEVAGFSVSYSGNGVINGTVAISNVEKKRVNLSFTKTDRTNPAKKLKGAVFSLYSDQEATQIVTAYTDEAREHASTAFTSGADGLVKIYGLKAGTYYLKETRAPDGYFLINGVMRITINEDGIITGATGPGGPQGQVITLNPSNHTVTVADIPFYELPSAGGPGTYGLTIVGVALIAGALLILIDNHSKRKGDRL